MKRILAVFLLILCAGRAFALPLEWQLVRGDVRDCLIATLEAEERFDELDFLEATEQMSHGSSFLWKLAADWHYLGHRTDDILFIVGAAMTDLYLDFEDELAQDGLVNTFSATMLTQADGAAFAARTFFVDRIHSSSLSSLEFLDYFGLARGVSLVSLPGASQDPVFKLVHGYLNDTDYFADGAVPSQQRAGAPVREHSDRNCFGDGRRTL